MCGDGGKQILKSELQGSPMWAPTIRAINEVCIIKFIIRVLKMGGNVVLVVVVTVACVVVVVVLVLDVLLLGEFELDNRCVFTGLEVASGESVFSLIALSRLPCDSMDWIFELWEEAEGVNDRRTKEWPLIHKMGAKCENKIEEKPKKVKRTNVVDVEVAVVNDFSSTGLSIRLMGQSNSKELMLLLMKNVSWRQMMILLSIRTKGIDSVIGSNLRASMSITQMLAVAG